ncbi:ATP-binding protein [Massilia sp. HP4]|uniref:ATP-binding protein n=1 Tax=Massilia sp. HP4 TaxID=2562316 RepID=UPI0010C05497|nr:ATP-binding protein [Massilia sp. HP4]
MNTPSDHSSSTPCHASEQDLAAARQELQRAAERMENMLESLTDGFCAVDRDWRITYINGRALQMVAPLNKSRDSLVGRRLWDEFEDLHGTSVAADCLRAMEQRITVNKEFFYRRLQCWLDMRVYPSPDGLTLYFQDISARKLDQQALIDNNNRLQLAIAAGRLGDWRWDAASDRVTFGRRAAEILGLPADSALEWPLLRARLAQDDRPRVRRAVLEAFSQGKDLDLECHLLPLSGAARCVALVGRPDYASPAQGGGVLGMTGMAQDISARREADDHLRQSEEELRALANTIPQLAWMADPSGAIVWFNQRWYEYTGITPSESTGWGWKAVYDPAVLPAVLEHWDESVRTGTPFEMEFPIRGADGNFRWFLTRVEAVHDRDGRVVRWFGTNTDVDQVKRAEQALREESHVLELLNSTGSILASTRDLRSLMQAATDAAAGVCGARFGAFFHYGEQGAGTLFSLYTLSGATSADFQDFAAPGASALFSPGAGLVRIGDLGHDPQHAGKAPQFGLPAGHPPVRSYLSVPVMARSGELLGTMFFGHPEPGVFTERSERIVSGIAAQAAIAVDNIRLVEAASRAAEERKVLLENEREARAEAERTSQMKDEFLATLSHELRTPLSAILGWSQVLRRGSRDGADLQRGLSTIERNARAQAQLIEDLLDMSRITSGKVLLDMQTLAPASFIDAAIETVLPAADAKGIRIERHYGTDAPAVAGDPGRLQQVIWNLLSNAIKFTPRDGLVTIAVGRHDEQVAITIRDTGAGIGPEFITHVFERFRQADASMTRSHGGLGLGLSIVKHLVEQHGGTVRAESAGVGRGASFTIELPVAKTPPRATQSARAQMILQSAPSAAGAGDAGQAADTAVRDMRGTSVLVVDDDRDARELIARILADCQASVRLAASAREAYDLLRAEPPDLLISDLGMPEVDGLELLSWVRALPREAGGQVAAIALTAFARSEDRLKALEAGFSAHVSKPVEQAELMAAIGMVSSLAGAQMVNGARTSVRG